MNNSFKKAVLTVALISSPALTLAAEMNIQGSTNQNSATQVQASQQQLSSDSHVNGEGQANIRANDQAFTEARARSESSAQQVSSTATSLRSDAESEASQSAASTHNRQTVALSTESENRGELMVETVDGLSLDLNNHSAVSTAATVTTETTNLLERSVEATAELGQAVQATTDVVIDNSVSSVQSLSEAAEVNAGIHGDMASHQDAFVSTEGSMSDDLSSELQTQNGASGTGGITGGLL